MKKKATLVDYSLRISFYALLLHIQARTTAPFIQRAHSACIDPLATDRDGQASELAAPNMSVPTCAAFRRTC
jgi:hypothetical protein